MVYLLELVWSRGKARYLAKGTISESKKGAQLYMYGEPGQHYLSRRRPDILVIQAEIATLENTGRLPASAYQGATMYTTLSPCDMCTGACVLYKIGRVVIGENNTFVGGEAYLKQRGIEVVVLQDVRCEALMRAFISDKPQIW